MLERESVERRGWTGKRGSLEFCKPAPCVGVIIFRGKVTDDAAAAWHEHFPGLVQDGGVHLFLDAGELGHAGMRMAAIGISMIAKARAQVVATHVLVRTGYTEMLADAANLTFGGYMQMHREREAFESELARVLGS